MTGANAYREVQIKLDNRTHAAARIVAGYRVPLHIADAIENLAEVSREWSPSMLPPSVAAAIIYARILVHQVRSLRPSPSTVDSLDAALAECPEFPGDDKTAEDCKARFDRHGSPFVSPPDLHPKGIDPEKAKTVCDAAVEVPPLGAMPERIWREKRVDELLQAIERYRVAGRFVKSEACAEWFAEIVEHMRVLRSMRK